MVSNCWYYFPLLSEPSIAEVKVTQVVLWNSEWKFMCLPEPRPHTNGRTHTKIVSNCWYYFPLLSEPSIAEVKVTQVVLWNSEWKFWCLPEPWPHTNGRTHTKMVSNCWYYFPLLSEPSFAEVKVTQVVLWNSEWKFWCLPESRPHTNGRTHTKMVSNCWYYFPLLSEPSFVEVKVTQVMLWNSEWKFWCLPEPRPHTNGQTHTKMVSNCWY